MITEWNMPANVKYYIFGFVKSSFVFFRSGLSTPSGN